MNTFDKKDVPEKHPGITHFALLCPDMMAARDRLEAVGVPLSGGPVRFGPGAQGIFVRDPDGNVKSSCTNAADFAWYRARRRYRLGSAGRLLATGCAEQYRRNGNV